MRSKLKLQLVGLLICLLIDLIGQYIWQARVSLSICMLIVILLQVEERAKLVVLVAVALIGGWWASLASAFLLAAVVVLGLHGYLQHRVPKLLQAVLLSSGFVSSLVLCLAAWQIPIVIVDLVGWWLVLLILFLIGYRTQLKSQLKYAI
jgi:hypothetical protein